jgi:hypothetical protein
VSGAAWLNLVALALVSALSPTALVPAIFLLSRGGPHSLLAFALGSICSVAVVAGLVATGLVLSGSGGSHGTSNARAVLELVVGLVCLVAAQRVWAGRTTTAERARAAQAAPEKPSRWLVWVDRAGVVGAYLFGLFWINGVFAVDAGLVIGQADLGSWGTTLAVVGYAVAAAGGALFVLGVYYADPERSKARLDRSRAWLQIHGREALAVLLYAVALLFVAKGAAGVLS